MKNLKSIYPYLRRYKWRLLLGVLFTALSNLCAVFSPGVIGHAQDVATGTVKVSNEDWLFNIFGSTIFSFAVLVLTFALLRGLFLFFMRQTLIVMSRKIEYDQKSDLYTHYQKLDLNFYKKNNTGDLMNRMTDDISRVRMFTGPTIMYTINLVSLFIIVIFMMWSKSHVLTFFAIAPIPVMGIIIFYVNNIIEKKSEKIQQQLSNLTTFTQESFSGIRLIKSYVQEKHMSRFFGNEAELYKQKNLSLAKVESIYFPIISFLVGLSVIATVYVGGRLCINNQISPGIITEFFLYINLLTWPMASVGWTMALLQRASASQKRIDEFMNVRPEIRPAGNSYTGDLRGGIEFQHVSFTYANTGKQALKDVSFRLEPGQKMAVIGRVGSGKTTIAQLLVRAYDAEEGKIRINGRELKDISLQTLRKQVGYVPQDVFLFSESVADNINFGLENKDTQRVYEAARAASVYDEILSLPEHFETVIGERGVTLSGGQKQRISIARALIKDPPVIIMDDCLSAVDAKTEKTILSHLQNSLENKTAIIITNRIFSLLKFDKILFLENGQILEEGTHEELLLRKGAYAALYQMQMMEEAD